MVSPRLRESARMARESQDTIYLGNVDYIMT